MDTAPVINPTSLTDQRCDGSISLKVIPDWDITIDRLDAYIDIIEPTNVRFLIADNPQNTVLYYGPPVAVGTGTQWIQSPAFRFTLSQGQTYEIAAMVEGCAYFPWDLIPASENGLTTTSTNGNPENYAAPTNFGELNGVDPRFRIYGDAQSDAIPTVGFLGGVLMVFALLVSGLMVRRKYSV